MVVERTILEKWGEGKSVFHLMPAAKGLRGREKTTEITARGGRGRG